MEVQPDEQPFDTPRSPGAPLGVLHRRRPKIAVRSGTLFAAVREFEKYSELVMLVGVRGNNGVEAVGPRTSDKS